MAASFRIKPLLQWMQNNSELMIYHYKRWRKREKGKGKQEVKNFSVHEYYNAKHVLPFNLNTVGAILTHTLLHYTVNCKSKKLWSIINAATRLNKDALLLQPKHNNFAPDIIQRRIDLSFPVC
jgi:hypothetical protein